MSLRKNQGLKGKKPVMKINWPTVEEITRFIEEVKEMNDEWIDEEGEEVWIEVRLQVEEDSSWVIHTGNSQYNTDSSGFFAVDYIGKESDCEEIASNLLEEVKDYAYIAGYE